MRRLLLLVACTGMCLLGMGTPATAQVTASPIAIQTGTWVGQVVPHDGHFDYVGSSCPIEVDFCIAIEVRYRIAPVTAQAIRALPTVAGHTAALTGQLLPLSAGPHHGVLFVSHVAPAP